MPQFQIPEPKYVAFLLRQSNNGVQVHGFMSVEDAEAAAATGLHELTLPKGKLVALVSTPESALAILPAGARWHIRDPDKKIPKYTVIWTVKEGTS